MSVLEQCSALELTDEDRQYLAYHDLRLERDLALVQQLTSGANGRRARVLDVGPHFLTHLLRERTDCIVDQIGHAWDAITRPRADEVHLQFDLNLLSERERWPRIGPYDVVVAAEVIEHLHISPTFFLGFLHECLVPGGYLLLQTPNGVALKRRVAMLLGQNPFELIRENSGNPGHFREYTRREMISYVRAAGFDVVTLDSGVYFNYGRRGLAGKIYGIVLRLLPPSLRDGMTFVLRRSAGSG